MKILDFLCESNMQFLPADQALLFQWQPIGLSCPEFFLCVSLPSIAEIHRSSCKWYTRSPGTPELVTLLLALLHYYLAL